MANFAGKTLLDKLPWVIVPLYVGGALRGQDREVGIAQSRALQMAKTGLFDDYDQMMEYSAANNTDIHRQYAGTNALDWLKAAGVVGLSALTRNPTITLGSAAWALDRRAEKQHRANEFRRIFEENLE